MNTLKDEIAELIHHLPEDSTLEDIQYHIYVLEKIRKGQQSIKNGKGISNEEAKDRLSKWITK
jgi:DNA mismatch repair ATPase MutL